MKAWVLERPGPLAAAPLTLRDLDEPVPGPGEVLVRVTCCALCRTDIHIVQGEISLPVVPVIPGHQIVGRVIERAPGATRFAPGTRVGIAWLHRTCGSCPDCGRGDENLCRRAEFTGYHRPGGFAELVTVPEAFAYPLPEDLDDVHAAPLLCAGIIGYRALRLADVTRGERVGLFGFGSSAHIALQIVRHRGNRVFVFTRGERRRDLARRLGAEWAGGPGDAPPEPLDRVVIFAPAGELVLPALEAVRWGGTVASAAIHMSTIPPMDYGRHLYGERTLRSTTASTRQDGQELLREAAFAGVRPEVTTVPFADAPAGLAALAADQMEGSAVLIIEGGNLD